MLSEQTIGKEYSNFSSDEENEENEKPVLFSFDSTSEEEEEEDEEGEEEDDGSKVDGSATPRQRKVRFAEDQINVIENNE